MRISGSISQHTGALRFVEPSGRPIPFATHLERSNLERANEASENGRCDGAHRTCGAERREGIRENDVFQRSARPEGAPAIRRIQDVVWIPATGNLIDVLA